jgi:hypothetical protein
VQGIQEDEQDNRRPGPRRRRSRSDAGKVDR